MRILIVVVLSLLLSPAAASAQVPAELIAYPELVLVNGKILTVDPSFTIVEAVAVRDGRVFAVGTTAEISRLRGPATRTIDVAGKTVVPGFIDNNADGSFAGGDLYKETMVNGTVLPEVTGTTLPEVLAKFRALVETAAPGSPVFIRAPEEMVEELAKLRIEDGDRLAPRNPLIIFFSSSEGFVNTAMLERAIAAGLPRDHIGIVRDPSGKPTGLLFSTALGMVGWNLRDWPVLTEEVFKQQETTNADLLRAGVTTITGHASGYTVTILSQLYHDGRLKLRARPDLDFVRQNPLAAQFLRRTPNLVNFGLGDGMIRIAGAALGPVDGDTSTGGVLTNEPKLRVHPVIGGGPFGRNKWTGSTFTGRQWSDLTAEEQGRTEGGTALLLRKHGWNIGGNHNMGSQATSIVIETLLAAERQPDIKVKKMLARNSLDHNVIWDARSIAMAKSLGDSLAFGLAADMWNAGLSRGEDMFMSQYGESWMAKMQPVKDLIGAGLNVHLEGGSANRYALWRIERYVTRTAGYRPRSERPAGRAPAMRTWSLEQAIDRQQALRMVTINAARFISEEQMLGSIERGKYADMVVLNGDYLAVPADQIDELEVVMTIVGGKVVWEASPAPAPR
jgi:hypothetical protein